MNKRNSSFEAIKVIAVIMIVLSHSIPDTGGYIGGYDTCVINLYIANKDITYFVLRIFRNLGQIGNDIFVVCSAWFLLDSKQVNVNKIVSMIGDGFIVSVIMLSAFIIAGFRFPTLYLIKQFFPITLGNTWYITVYLLLYAIHPLLNIVIDKLDKRTLLRVDIGFILLYCCNCFIMNNSVLSYSDLLAFIGIYFIVAYVKLYMRSVTRNKMYGVAIVIIGIVGWFMEKFIILLLGLKISMFSNQAQKGNIFINPCYIIIAVGLLIIANNLTFYHGVVNYISSLSFLIYIIHCNIIMRNYGRYEFFEYIYLTYTYNYLLLWVIIFMIINLFGALTLAIIYHMLLQNKVHKFFIGIVRHFRKFYGKLESVIFRIE